MIKFKKLEIHNYGPFKDATLGLDNQGVVLVEGKNHSNNAYQSNGSGKCLSGETLVFNADKNSYERLDTFVDNKVEHTLGLVNYKLQVVPVTGWHKTGIKPVYKLRTDGGAEITGAETHPVLTDTGYKPISELNVDDWVAETRKLPTSPNQNALPDKFWFALGILLGDGGLTKGNGVGVTLTNMEECIFDAVVEGIKVMDSTCHFGKSDHKSKAATARLNAIPNFSKWLSAHGLREKSVNKKIPNTIMNTLTTSNTEYLLSGLYITDGAFPSAQQKAPRRVLDFTTGSKDLAYNIKELWLKLGVPTSVATRKVKNMPGHTYWRVVTFSSSYDICLRYLHLIGNRVESLNSVAEVFAKQAYTTPQSNKDIIPPTFNKYVTGHFPRVYPVGVNPLYYHRTESQLKTHGFSRDTFACWVPEGNAIAHSDVTWVKVKSIDYVGDEPCYDLTIGNSDHSYLANNIIVHNSNILSGITYALYGKTVEGISGDGVINRQAGTDCHVFLWLERDGDEYRIERYRKGAKGNANKVKLFVNGKEVTTSRTSLTNEKIESLMGIDFGTYVNTIAYGQGDVPVFSQATDKEKKEILESLANIAVYEKAQAVAKDDLSEVTNSITDADSHIRELTSKQALISQYIEQEKENIARLKAQEEEDKQKKIYANQQLVAERFNYNNLKTQHDEDARALSEYKANNPIPSVADLTSKVQELSSRYASASSSASQAKQSLQDTVNQLKESSKAKVCPMCGQTLDDAHRKAEIVRLQELIKGYLAQYQASDEACKQVKPEYDITNTALSKIDARVKEIYSEMQSLQERERLSNGLLLKSESSIRLIEERVRTLENAKYDYSSHDYSGDLENVEASLTEYRSKKEALAAKAEELETVVKDIYSRKGVSSMALDLIVPFLNERTNYYLAKLSGSIIQINMSTQTLNANNTLSDKFDIQVDNESGANNYQACSTGERKRIDLAISFAIQDLQNSRSNMATNIAIYDECFDGLDAVGAETVISLLKEKSKSIGSIFVITHNDTLKPLFDSVITIEKGRDGIARIGGKDAD